MQIHCFVDCEWKRVEIHSSNVRLELGACAAESARFHRHTQYNPHLWG